LELSIVSKKIILCTDGTWDNTATATNVFKIYHALQVSSDQIPLYDDGVGADGTPIEQLVGGAFGLDSIKRSKMDIRRSRTCMNQATRFSYSASVEEPIRLAVSPE
jgi:uncharacterized protein (DUF2235 family)